MTQSILPRLTTLPPLSVPAEPEKNYPETWKRRMLFDAPGPRQPVSFQVSLVPYDPASGQIAPGSATVTAAANDFAADCAKYPKLAAAYAAFAALAAGPYAKVVMLRSRINAAKDERDRHQKEQAKFQAALPEANALPDSSPVKAARIAWLIGQAQAAKDALSAADAQIAALEAEIAVEESSLRGE